MIIPSSRGTARRGGRPEPTGPARLTDEELTGYVMSPLASCASAAIAPDESFPVASTAARVQAEAARALAVCATCPVRAECLELSLRHWRTVGRHGIWGGLVEAERAAARRRWLAGAEVARLLRSPRDAADLHRGAMPHVNPRDANPDPVPPGLPVADRTAQARLALLAAHAPDAAPLICQGRRGLSSRPQGRQWFPRSGGRSQPTLRSVS
jgi:WhiB family redox-sensing transcriptional regulator